MTLYALFRSARYPVTLSAGLLRGAFGDVGYDVPVVVCCSDAWRAEALAQQVRACGYRNVTIEATTMNPYLLPEPSVVSFSGGRTSGYMLRQILDAFGGKLPPLVKVIFANTGKERPETLDFVERVSIEWDVPIVWLEYRNRYLGTRVVKTGKYAGETKAKYQHTFAEVNYATASRNGEPFVTAIKAHNFLPNPVTRFCTYDMKVKTINRYVQSLGWEHYTDAVGLRYDEPRRVAKWQRLNRLSKPCLAKSRHAARRDPNPVVSESRRCTRRKRRLKP